MLMECTRWQNSKWYTVQRAIIQRHHLTHFEGKASRNINQGNSSCQDRRYPPLQGMARSTTMYIMWIGSYISGKYYNISYCGHVSQLILTILFCKEFVMHSTIWFGGMFKIKMVMRRKSTKLRDILFHTSGMRSAYMDLK